VVKITSAPAVRSKVTTPAFGGEASETDPVTVEILNAKAEVVETVGPATVSGGKWLTGAAGALLEGKYTAVAVEESSLEDGPGRSEAMAFEVHLKPPVVKITSAPAARSNVTTPTFGGEASETDQVTVEILNAKAELVETVGPATVSGGKWLTGAAGALLEGKYTAVAVQESSIGDGPGKSPAVPFEVHLKPPIVTVNTIPRSKNTKPAFAGTASETNAVTVKVYNEEDELVRTLTAAVEGGTWTTQPLSQALSDGQYTVTASEESSIVGDGLGESEPRPFTISTRPPGVAFTTTPPARSNNTEPTFAGEASETNPVTVKIYKESELVQTSSPAPVSGRDWSVTLSTPLPEGTYTAVAYEESSIGNGIGHSEPPAPSFEVHVKPPVVKFSSTPPPRSRNTTPSFEGSASETEPVTVEILNSKGELVESVGPAAVSAGKWAAGPAGTLAEGNYTAVAVQESSIGNGPGKSEPAPFEVHVKPPIVAISALPHSNNKSPSFSGEASETKLVTVKIYPGAAKSGTAIESIVSGAVTGGKWSTGAAPKVLEEGEYTAVAYEESSIEGDGAGESKPLAFLTHTKPPTVKLTSTPAPRSKVTQPSFGGTASETKPVTVKIFEGPTATGTPVDTLTSGAVTSEQWSTKPASPALNEGTYTAVAYEESSIEDGTGESQPVIFEVHLKPPVVTLTPIKRSNIQTPSFSGTASETKAVTVKIYKGSTKDGTFVESVASGTVSGNWSAGPAGSLPEGEYTAVAYQESSIEDGLGESEPQPFEIFGKPPKVTLHEPPEKSGELNPSFSGTAGEAGTVIVRLYEGVKAEGTVVAQLQTPTSGGAWSTARVGTALAEGTYTVKASEQSSIENGTGESEADTFEVVTGSPTARLNAPPSPSKNLTPSFSGTTNESSSIVVEVFEGSKHTGSFVTVHAKVEGTSCSTKAPCKWSSERLASPLAEGLHTYSAIAKQESALGNAPGLSEAVLFVVDTEPPSVELSAPRPLTNDATPEFSGSSTPSSEAASVMVSVYKGENAEGTPVATAEATPSGGKWVTKPLSAPLESAEYAVVARQKSSLGNLEGHSEAARFRVERNPSTVVLASLPSPSPDVTPSFSGTASAATPVTVHIYSGANEEGTEVMTVEAEKVLEGNWATPALTEALEDGEYTAVATEPPLPELAGNREGKSEPIRFDVVSREPAVANVTSSVVEGGNSAYMNATVNPNGGGLDYCRFEYGTTAAFGKSADCAFEVGGKECAFVYPPKTEVCPSFPPEKETAVYARVNGLAFGNKYFFRLVVENAGDKGTKASGESTFAIEGLDVGPPGERTHVPPPKEHAKALTISEVEAEIVKQLAPSGNAATIAKLLKKGSFDSTLKVPVAGTAVINWYYLPKGATLAGRSSKASKAHKPVLVASGKVSVSSAETVTVKMGLTESGRRLLRSAKKIRLTARCIFTPSGEKAITTYKTFQLTRG
jgi:flagellar hook assembly protein FlgD